VERVDQHVVGAVIRAENRRHVGEVGEVADSPRLCGPYGVQLRQDAPPLTVGQGPGGGQTGRRHDQGARLVEAVVAASAQGVPSEGKPLGDRERRSADQRTVDLPRIDPHIHLLSVAHGSVLDLHGHGDGRSVRYVDSDARRLVRARDVRRHHHDGRQGAAPRSIGMRGDRQFDVVVAVGADVESAEHGPQSGFVHVTTGFVPALVRRGDAVQSGEVA
jgi:hypothetical protein